MPEELNKGAVKPNAQASPGPIGNTQGIIVPKTATNPDGDSAPPPQPQPKEEGWWKRWGSDWTHGLLDGVGLIPVAGEAANAIGALVYLAEGDKISAAMDFAAMWPAGGQAATAAKYGRKAVGVAVEQAEKAAAKETAEAAAKRLAKEAEEAAAKKAAKDGGYVKGDPRCILRPYKPDTCKPRTGHHVVPDRVFRTGKQGSTRIKGGISEADGLVICVDGANASRSKEHGQIHAIYDPLEAVAGLAGTPIGTAPLGELEMAGALAAGKVTGCNPLLLEAQLRTYHQAKGLGIDTIVRADPTGKLPVDATKLGRTAAVSSGSTR